MSDVVDVLAVRWSFCSDRTTLLGLRSRPQRISASVARGYRLGMAKGETWSWSPWHVSALVQARSRRLCRHGATPIPEELERALDYLRTRVPEIDVQTVLSKLAKALADLTAAVRELPEQRLVSGEGWTHRHIVDHIAQTNIRSAEELRHLAAGRTPPGPPVYDGLRSGAPEWAPWAELVEGLAGSSSELLSAARAASDAEPSDARVIAIVVIEGVCHPTKLEWKGYAMLQRLHAIDHRNQLRAR